MLVYQTVNCAWQSQSLVNFLQHLATFGVLKEPEKSHLVMVPLWTQKQLVKVVKGHSSPKYGAINSKILGKWMFMMFIYPKMVGIDGIDRSPSPLITVDHDVITKSLQLHRHLGRSIWLVTSCHPKYSRHFNVFQLDQRIDFPEAHSMFSILGWLEDDYPHLFFSNLGLWVPWFVLMTWWQAVEVGCELGVPSSESPLRPDAIRCVIVVETVYPLFPHRWPCFNGKSSWIYWKWDTQSPYFQTKPYTK